MYGPVNELPLDGKASWTSYSCDHWRGGGVTKVCDKGDWVKQWLAHPRFNPRTMGPSGRLDKLPIVHPVNLLGLGTRFLV